MIINLIEIAGKEAALFGLGLSYGLTSDFGTFLEYQTHEGECGPHGCEQPVRWRMPNIANRLSSKDGGHNKFLESIVIWLDIKAPRYWWSEFDTYRVGTSKQSESTMHSIMREPLSKRDFEGGEISDTMLKEINDKIKGKDFFAVKKMLPEGYLQRRVVCTNYAVLRNMYRQRHDHRLKEWHMFCEFLRGLENSNWITAGLTKD